VDDNTRHSALHDNMKNDQLPLNAYFRRVGVVVLLVVVRIIEKISGLVYLPASSTRWRLSNKLRLPPGTIVEQTEYKKEKRGPWRVKCWTGEDYCLVSTDKDYIYLCVFPSHIRVIR
jgi:hypothetical protein